MFKKILYKLSVFGDSLKGIIISLIVWILIVFFALMIVHNILKLGEYSNLYEGDYKNLVMVDEDKMMNIKVFGATEINEKGEEIVLEGKETIVILPGYGMQSPVIQYKAIVDQLKDEYKVAVVEYYGYGFSMNIDKERTNENIASEVKAALASQDIHEFILMPHSISNVYALKMIENYPSSVKAVVSLDGVSPSQYKEVYFKEQIIDQSTNVKLTDVLENCGFQRYLSYIKPEMFYIDSMKTDGIWGTEEIKVLRERIALSYLSDTMKKEIEEFSINVAGYTNYKYPNTLPVLQILSKETASSYLENKKEGLIEKELKEYANDLVSNKDIQLITTVEGNHDLQFTAYQKVAELTKEFLTTGKVTETESVEESDSNIENTVENKVVEVVVVK